MIVLWEAQSEGEPPARCTYQSTSDTPCLITVTVGETQIIREECDSEVDAIDEASYLLADFATRGWTTMMYRDPRIAHP